jgi:hemerythrin-like domain-containing protein
MRAPEDTRRALLTGAATGAWLLFTGCTRASSPAAEPETARRSDVTKSGDKAKGEDKEPVVTPGEDLMQEHGLVERVLLVYEEVARRIEAHAEVDPATLGGATALVERFIQDYHEKSEEEFVFPALEAKKREVELVRVLRLQHQRGRELTAEIARRTKNFKASPELAAMLRDFSRMYRPHAAFEDTRAFPAFRETLDDAAYRELGEKFEDREHERLGARGFEQAVAEIARLEASLGVGELDKFTPESPTRGSEHG